MVTVVKASDSKPPPNNSIKAKPSCKHEWLYKLSTGWYCRLCPATAAIIHKGLGGSIALDEPTAAKMQEIAAGQINKWTAQEGTHDEE